MTFHVFCPIGKKRYDFNTLISARRFVVAMMRKYPDCKKTIQIKDGRKLYGKMWKVNKMIYFRAKGRRKVSLVSETGNLRK